MSDNAFKEPGVDWIGVRFQDPIGRVYRENGEYFRVIYPESETYVEELLEAPSVKKAIANEWLVGTRKQESEIDGYNWELRHETGFKQIRPARWPYVTLLAAARTYLDLCEVLLDDGYGLLDGHLANFAQFNGKPKWIDFGSICRVGEGKHEFVGLEEFRRCLFNPLALVLEDPSLSRVARELMASGGISDAEFKALLSSSPALRKIPVGDRVHFPAGPSLREKRAEMKKRRQKWNQRRRWLLRLGMPGRVLLRLTGVEMPTELKKDPATEMVSFPRRRETIKTMREFLDREIGDTETMWSEYQTEETLDRSHGDSSDPRVMAIGNLLEKVGGKTVVDLASNAGRFSILAEKAGYSVVAIDYDETAMDRLAKHLLEGGKDLRICCATYDLTAVRNPDLECDVAMALALTHHLTLGQGFPFSYVARLLADYTTDSLITEFMPNGLGVMERKPDPLPASYSLETFVGELEKLFSEVEVVPYERRENHSPRDLIFCRGKKP